MAQYFFSENGQSMGPFSAQQLRDFAQAGRIQPVTLVWKEGTPQWLPATNFKGLLPSAGANGIQGRPPSTFSMVMPPLQPPPVSAPQMEYVSGGQGRLWLLLAGIAGGLVALAILVIVLVNSKDAGKDSNLIKKNDKAVATKGTAKTGDTELDDEPPPDDKKAPVSLPKKKVEEEKTPEMGAPLLLDRYTKNPQQTLKEYQGKKVILQIEGQWNVEELTKAINPKGDLEIYFQTKPNNQSIYDPDHVIFLTFPDVDPKSKLGFFAKIKEYAAKWKKGEKVNIRVIGTISTCPQPNTTFKAGTYLHLVDAELL